MLESTTSCNPECHLTSNPGWLPGSHYSDLMGIPGTGSSSTPQPVSVQNSCSHKDWRAETDYNPLERLDEQSNNLVRNSFKPLEQPDTSRSTQNSSRDIAVLISTEYRGAGGTVPCVGVEPPPPISHPSENYYISNYSNAAVVSSDQDTLTGIANNQPLTGQTANAPAMYSFNTGYGLVDAAKAVAMAMGYSASASVPDVQNAGGVDWNNDMIKAQEAWNLGATGQGVTVAVIDSGVDISHPELHNNIWQNPYETAGDGIDNDGNGYVDDLYGWNFASNQYNNTVSPRFNMTAEAHGTHVAGTIAAAANGYGTTGVAPNAKIMALRIGDTEFGSDGRGYFRNQGRLSEAIYYAVDNGARVINMSLSWTPSADLENALAYAASQNVIVVSAAGNSAGFQPEWPANYAVSYGVSVGAVNSTGTLASFSNRAGWDSQLNHVVAPGVNIWSTMPTNDYDGKIYDQMNGTSMAAPHVAGVVALMLSANPDLTHAQVRYILAVSASSYDYSGFPLNEG